MIYSQKLNYSQKQRERIANDIRRTARLFEASEPNRGEPLPPSMPAEDVELIMKTRRSLATLERLAREEMADRFEAGEFIDEAYFEGLFRLDHIQAIHADKQMHEMEAFQQEEEEIEGEWAQEDQAEEVEATLERGRVLPFERKVVGGEALKTPEKKGFWEKLRK